MFKIGDLVNLSESKDCLDKLWIEASDDTYEIFEDQLMFVVDTEPAGRSESIKVILADGRHYNINSDRLRVVNNGNI